MICLNRAITHRKRPQQKAPENQALRDNMSPMLWRCDFTILRLYDFAAARTPAI
jgi:hypothetical protein